MRSNISGKVKGSEAFTLVELLVVLAILAVLASLTLPGLAGAQGPSRQAQCAANLKQFTLATLSYAGENGDRVPTNVSSAPWAFMLAPGSTDSLAKFGAARQQFYCPSNPDQNADGLWNFTSAYRVIGYSVTFPNTGLIASNINFLSVPQPLVVGPVALSPPAASKRVLVADVIISQAGQNNTANKLTYKYTGVQGGYPVPHRTSHLDLVGQYPTGGNVGMLDGHVEWTPFANVICRTSGGNPGFWW